MKIRLQRAMNCHFLGRFLIEMHYNSFKKFFLLNEATFFELLSNIWLLVSVNLHCGAIFLTGMDFGVSSHFYQEWVARVAVPVALVDTFCLNSIPTWLFFIRVEDEQVCETNLNFLMPKSFSPKTFDLQKICK